MRAIYFTFLIMLLVCRSAFSQSKKDQIEVLIFQKDSLGRVLQKERQLNSDQVKQLETKISKINSDMALIQKEVTQSKKVLAKKEEEILGHQLDHVLREDTIRSLREELHQIKSSKLATFLPYFWSPDSVLSKKVKQFYSSLELSYELNQRHYIEGNVDFDTSIFNSFLTKNSLYSKVRVSNLTGEYHDRYNVKLVSIDLINLDSEIEIISTVEYGIYECGTFKNLEKLVFNYYQNELKLIKWEDLGVKDYESSYGCIESIDDFYKYLGSLNK